MDSTKLSLAAERKLQQRRDKRDWTATRGSQVHPKQSFKPFYHSEPYFPRQTPRRCLQGYDDSITQLFHRISSYGGTRHLYFPVGMPQTSLHSISVDTTIRFRSNLGPKLDSEVYMNQELHAPSVEPEPFEESSPLNAPNNKPESHKRQFFGKRPFKKRANFHKRHPFNLCASNGKGPHRVDVAIKSELKEELGDKPKRREDFLENKDRAGAPLLFLNSPKRAQRTFSGNLRTFDGVDAFGAR